RAGRPLEGHTHSSSLVLLRGGGQKLPPPRHYHVAEVRILREIAWDRCVITGWCGLRSEQRRTVGNARRFLRYATKRRHTHGSDDPLLTREIQSVPQPRIKRFGLRQIVIPQPEIYGELWPYLPFVLNVNRPGSIFVLHRSRTGNGELSADAAWQTQKRGRQRQTSAAAVGEASLAVTKTEPLKRVLLDSLCFNNPKARLQIVTALYPSDIWSDAPVWILSRRLSADAEIIAASGYPFAGGEPHENAGELIDVFET